MGKLKQASEDKARAARSAKVNADAKELGKGKQAAVDKQKAITKNTGPGKIPANPTPKPGKDLTKPSALDGIFKPKGSAGARKRK